MFYRFLIKRRGLGILEVHSRFSLFGTDGGKTFSGFTHLFHQVDNPCEIENQNIMDSQSKVMSGLSHIGLECARF